MQELNWKEKSGENKTNLMAFEVCYKHCEGLNENIRSTSMFFLESFNISVMIE